MKPHKKNTDKLWMVGLMDLAVDSRIIGLKEALEIIRVCDSRGAAIDAIRERVQNVRNDAEKQKREAGGL